jgi:hypothetical protein
MFQIDGAVFKSESRCPVFQQFSLEKKGALCFAELLAVLGQTIGSLGYV